MRRIRRSEEYADFIKNVAENLPSSYELLQFLPMKLFSNTSVYFALLNFNNCTLHDAITNKRAQLRGDPSDLVQMG